MNDLQALKNLEELGNNELERYERIIKETLSQDLEKSKQSLTSGLKKELQRIRSDMQKEQNGYIIGVWTLTAMTVSILLIGAVAGALSYYLFAPDLLKSDWEVPKSYQVTDHGRKWLVINKKDPNIQIGKKQVFILLEKGK